MGEVIRQVTIRGRVQGVGFRFWTRRAATARGLQGWVRNRRDGSVEAVFSGPEETVLEIIELCRRGPQAARVDKVDEQAVGAEMLSLRRSGEHFSELNTL